MTKQQTIERIAREILDLDTLETRRMDSLDFTEQAVWSIAKALDVAYEAGRLAGQGRATSRVAHATFRVAAHHFPMFTR